jgi:hypothetical protein
MTERVITDTGTGRIVSYEETAEERTRRIRREGAAAALRLRLTSGQRRTLARARA